MTKTAPRTEFAAHEHLVRLTLLTGLRKRVKIGDIAQWIGTNQAGVFAVRDQCKELDLLDRSDQLTFNGAVYASIVEHYAPVAVKQTVPKLPKDPATLPPEGESNPKPKELDFRLLWDRVGDTENRLRTAIVELAVAGLVTINFDDDRVNLSA